jgi:ribosomal protein S18 acetylase RimI-like enzyme
MDLQIVKFQEKHIESFLKFSDRYIGPNYYRREELAPYLREPSFSYALVNTKTSEVLGIRLTLAAGQWMDKVDPKGLHPKLWNVAPEKVGYFKTIFLADDLRGQAVGQELSKESLSALKADGHEAVLCHSWNESPRNSSRRYLEKLGFTPVSVIENFWTAIDYECIRCGKPCLCSATEMICHL